jgi:hypothetical protein
MEKPVLKIIEESFINSIKGGEKLNILIYYWGFISYIICYLIINKIIYAIDIRTIDIFLSLIVCIYFIWHIYVIHKCKPKKIKLSLEEKKKNDLLKKKELPKKIMRKIFLKESIFKWDIVNVITAIDLFCIASFSSYFFN